LNGGKTEGKVVSKRGRPIIPALLKNGGRAQKEMIGKSSKGNATGKGAHKACKKVVRRLLQKKKTGLIRQCRTATGRWYWGSKGLTKKPEED